MKYAIISDIHSNLEALTAVLDDIKKHGIGLYVCAGDIVGYGANPNECADIIRGLECPCVLGNHDAGVIGATQTEDFNSPAQKAIEWTAGILSDENKAYLKSLKLVERVETFTVVHANLEKPDEWSYIFNSYEAERCFPFQKDTLCFFGHTHIQCAFKSNTDTPFIRSPSISIKSGHRYMVNPGSVGQPRDGNPDAAYAIYDMMSGKISYHRVPYDIKTAQQKILDAGLPNILASRLAAGR